MTVQIRWRHISPEISPKLITHLLERQGNWLIMFPLSRDVTGIKSPHLAVSQLARGMTNTNLTPWHGTLIVSVPGHEVRQDTATFTLRPTLMDITSDAVRFHVQHLQGDCASQTATRCNLGNLGHPLSNYSWWILTFGGLTLSSVAKSSNRARRGHGIRFRECCVTIIYCFDSYCSKCLMEAGKSKWAKLSRWCRGLGLIKLAWWRWSPGRGGPGRLEIRL